MSTMKKENIPNQSGLKPLSKLNENQKLPKPLIEKKRRARINRSLSDLRILISDLLKKELMRTRNRRKSGKVEKADVLELAVQYIKEMKQEKSVQKELAFEAGYTLCQQNVEEYFGKLKELNSKAAIETKSECCKQKTYLLQKELLKTLDQQFTEHVQNPNYNRKILEDKSLTQFDGQDKASGEITSANDLNKRQQMTIEQQEFNEKASDKQQFTHPDNLLINTTNLINEKVNTNTSATLAVGPNNKKYYPAIWGDKPQSKADELILIKAYNELVMHNLNRNKSLCSSASSTSSCSSGSSYAKTISSLQSGHHHLIHINQSNGHHQSNTNINSLPHVMPVDLESSPLNISSGSSFCSANSSGQPIATSKNSQEQHKSPISIIAKYSHLNSPYKKRKKIYQCAYDASSSLSDSLWRPW